MTTLEKTSAEIRRLVPRLMEVRRVCEIKSKKDNQLNQYRFTFVSFGQNEIIRFDTDEEFGNGQYSWIKNDTLHKTGLGNDNNLIIIEHPITLEDVLEALMKFDDDEEVNISRINDFYSMILRREWQFRKPYDQQSKEVHEFVANILF